jgi:DNA polymerase-3 subunit delta'
VPARDIAEALVARSLTDPAKAAPVAHIANGSYTEALRLVRQADNDLFPGVRDLFNHVFTGNGIGITKFAEEWSKAGREQQKNFLNYIIQLLEQAIRARYAPDAPLSLPQAEADFVRRLAGTKTTFEAFGKMIDTITDTIFYIERNAHSKTQLHAMCIRMQYIVQNKPLPVE